MNLQEPSEKTRLVWFLFSCLVFVWFLGFCSVVWVIFLLCFCEGFSCVISLKPTGFWMQSGGRLVATCPGATTGKAFVSRIFS